MYSLTTPTFRISCFLSISGNHLVCEIFLHFICFVTLHLVLSQVMLLGRLHHRNLVNLVGYCAEKGQHMLIYVYMSQGSLASHLYSKIAINFYRCMNVCIIMFVYFSLLHGVNCYSINNKNYSFSKSINFSRLTVLIIIQSLKSFFHIESDFK